MQAGSTISRHCWRSLRRFRTWASLSALFIVFGSMLTFITPKVAHADSNSNLNDYPWNGLTYQNAGNAWGDYGQCVSYVGWKIYEEYGGTQMPSSIPAQGWMPSDANISPLTYQHWSYTGAKDWYQLAINNGFAVDGPPRVGDAAVWMGAPADATYGHVAYVYQVNGDGSIDVSQYNFHDDSKYSTMHIPAGGSWWPHHFIHFNGGHIGGSSGSTHTFGSGLSKPASSFNTVLGHSEIFATATNGTIWYDYADSSGMAHWSQTDATHTFQGSPTAVFNTTAGHSEIFAIATDGTIWYDYVDSNGGMAHWSQTDATHTFVGSPVAVFNSTLHRSEVFAVATDGTIWYDYVDSNGGTAHWSQSDTIHTFRGSPAAVFDSTAGHSEIFATATNGTIWYDYVDATNGTAHWSQTDATHTFQNSPSANFNSTLGHAEIFVTATDGTMWFDYADSSGMAHWNQTDSTHTFQGAPAASFNTLLGHSEIFATATDGTMWFDYADSSGMAHWNQTES